MRFCLASFVVFWHTVNTTYGNDFEKSVWLSHWRVLVGPIVPVFFALSGFLVAGSLERCRTVMGFLFLRIIRIFPALIVEIIVSAFLLGPILTTYKISKYFSDPTFFSYLANCVGDVHYLLPGLFAQNALPFTVNGQLWTVPFELECYIVLCILAFVGITQRKWLFLATVIVLQILSAYKYFFGADTVDVVVGGRILVVCFLVGVLFYNFREFIPYNKWMFLICLCLIVILFSMHRGDYFIAFPIVYCTVYLGTMNPRRIWLLETGDYSYGIFLYGFPIQQSVVALGLAPLNPWLNLLISYLTVLALAVVSWHLWEKHMLNLRRWRPAIDRAFPFTAPGVVAARFPFARRASSITSDGSGFQRGVTESNSGN
jgi:peptidoglycan/LPS O-acetylase OafA/YrhL